MRIGFVTNTAWNLVNFRLGLMRSLQNLGHQVVALAPADQYSELLRAEGFEFLEVPMDGQSVSPLTEARTILRLARALRAGKVDAVFSYTPKGNLYTALACMGLRRMFVPTVSGLGRVFIRPSLVTHVVSALYRLTFRRAEFALFQNPADLDLFVAKKFVHKEQARQVAGSGIDTAYFRPCPVPQRPADAPVFLLVARMLWDKGIGEFVKAARLVRARYPKARFQLLGFLDVANPSSIPKTVLNGWVHEGVIEYLGSADDVRNAIAEADCVVLPSYREGIPRSLLEAAAMARPVIATHVPGCRDVLVAGHTGLLCEAASESSLAETMLDFMALTREQRRAMGQAGRAFVESRFDEKIVHSTYRHIVHAINDRSRRQGIRMGLESEEVAPVARPGLQRPY